MTTTNKFAGRCSVCDVYVEPHAGKAIKAGSKWQVRCLAHETTVVEVAPIEVAHLTQEQFSACDDAIGALLRASTRGTPERAAAEAVLADWERVCRLPQVTWQQRQDRLSAISAVAAKHNLR